MPELAEVEFYRKQWDDGLKQKILGVELHATKRLFRGVDTDLLKQTLTGATLLGSKTHGKQMLFRFSKDGRLGIHLGMTGKLRVERAGEIGKHDHLVLYLKKGALVFSDPRLFGRVLFHVGAHEPPWWVNLPSEILSANFTADYVSNFLHRHGRAPVKAVLLMQRGFPGVGNWMADEILWQSKINPGLTAGSLNERQIKLLWQKTQFVCREALKTIGNDFSDPPKTWLFQHRWRKKGHCPRCKGVLQHATIGGRTTCWCPKCQPE